MIEVPSHSKGPTFGAPGQEPRTPVVRARIVTDPKEKAAIRADDREQVDESELEPDGWDWGEMYDEQMVRY